MLELGGKRAVARDGRPAVVEQLHVGTADVDHRLDGEEHARTELGTGAGAAGVDDLGAVVEQAANAVAAEVADDGVAAGLGITLYSRSNVAQPVAGFRLLEADHKAFVGHVDQATGLDADVPDQEHAARVAVPAVYDRRHVDIDDIAILQRAVGRNAVA